MKEHLIPSKFHRDFILGGHAIFTVLNTKTDVRYTYKVRLPRHAKAAGKNKKYVSVMSGPDNERSYTYIGNVYNDTKFYWSDKFAKIPASDPRVAGWVWLFNRLVNNQPIPETVEIYHSGKCGCCGKTLTTPDSIKIGIGPVCIDRVLERF